MYHSELISMRLPTTLLQRLDAQRGPSSRAAYIRTLIEKDTRAANPAPIAEEPVADRLVTNQSATSKKPIPAKKTQQRKKAHKFKKYPDATKCEICGQREEWADPYCPG